MTIGRAIAGLLLTAGLGHGADPPIEKLDVRPRRYYDWTLPPGTPAEQVKWVIERQKQLQNEFVKKHKATKSEAEQDALFETEYPEPDAPAKLLLDLAITHPKDPAAFDALQWVVRNTSRPPIQPDIPFARARDILIRDFARHPRIGEVCLALGSENHHLPTVEFVREVFEKHPEAKARALAGLTRASHLRRHAGWAGTHQKENADWRANTAKVYGEEYADFLLRAKPDELNKEAEAVLDRLVSDKELAAVTYNRGTRTVGKTADNELFEIRHLLPGKPVPEITGEDIDGKPFKLSDYRGKVVLLDFWGDW